MSSTAKETHACSLMTGVSLVCLAVNARNKLMQLHSWWMDSAFFFFSLSFSQNVLFLLKKKLGQVMLTAGQICLKSVPNVAPAVPAL